MGSERRDMPSLLCLGAGNRTGHVEMLKRHFWVVTADSDPLVAAALVSDACLSVPDYNSVEFSDRIVKVVRENGIKVVVPASHEVLAGLDRARDELEAGGARVFAPGPDAIQIAGDRAKLFCFMADNGIPTVPLLDSDDDMPFPVAIEPVGGSEWREDLVAKSESELDFYFRYFDEAVIHPVVRGEEYVIEVVSDFDGHVLSAVPMRCIERHGRQLISAVTAKDTTLIDYSVEIVSLLGSVGCVSIRALRDGRRVYFTGIDCCFGEGATLSRRAGADPVAMLAAAVAGERVEYDESWRDGLMMSRGSRDYYVDFNEVAMAVANAEAQEAVPAGAGP